MAEFHHQSAIDHMGDVVGGISLDEEELDKLALEDVEFSDNKIDNKMIFEEFSEGTLVKLELDIDEEEIPDVDDRVYDHTYDDIETQLNQIRTYRNRMRRFNPYGESWTTRTPIEENCVVAILREFRNEKPIFRLYRVEGDIVIKPYQFKGIYPCFDKPLSFQFDLYQEFLAHSI